MELEKIVVRFYDEMEQGRFMGRKCPKCGAVSFPPYIACNACGNPKTEWYETSGRAEMYDFIMPIGIADDPELVDLKPYAFASVRIEEGVELAAQVIGMTDEMAPALEERIKRGETIPVHPVAVERATGYKSLAFALDED